MSPGQGVWSAPSKGTPDHSAWSASLSVRLLCALRGFTFEGRCGRVEGLKLDNGCPAKKVLASDSFAEG